MSKPNVVYRIVENRRRIKGGIQQRYQCVINDKPLIHGFMAESKINGEKVQTTVFVKGKQIESREGWDWHWLAEKNNRKFKKVA